MLHKLKLTLLRALSERAWASAYVGGGDFATVGNKFLGHFVRFGLQPTHDVLDIGCGTGRMSAPLADYLTAGSYVGVDVSKEAIEFCRKNVKRNNFRFIHADVFSSVYNPQGQPASRYSFPIDDESFDYIILCSVFTHMLPDDTERYLSEIARLLRPEGICFSTWFAMSSDTQPSLPFKKYSDRRCYVTKANYPEAAVAYDEYWITDAHTRCGLTAERHSGTWGGSKSQTFQDVVISRNTRPRR